MIYRLLALAFAALFIIGCGEQKATQPETEAVATETTSDGSETDGSEASGSGTAGTEGGAEATSENGSIEEVLKTGPRPGSISDFLDKAGSDTVQFDFDKFEIRDDQKDTLRRQAAWLRIYQAAGVMVEGHADERGTREYNLALGERRANAVKDFLVSMGVAPARITTISYGKERPAAFGSNSEAWAANRRGVTRIN